jgi:probable F420-dependent oxidoreductase
VSIQYGVQLHPLGELPSIEAIVELAQLIEELGFGYVALPEHTIFPAALERMLTRNWYHPLTMVTYLAARTRTLRFLTAVTILPQHNPIALAKQAATIDALSGGRLGLGVAGGWLEQEITWMGGDPRTRGRTVEEHLRLMQALWTQDPVNFSSAHHSITAASFHPKPRGGAVPILVGGAPRFSAPRAAQLGQGWMPSAAYTELPAAFDLLDQQLQQAGRSRAHFPVVFELPLFDQPEGVKQFLREIDARLPESFAGDYAQAENRAIALGKLGVTHATISPPFDDLGALHAQLRRFAAGFIGEHTA